MTTSRTGIKTSRFAAAQGLSFVEILVSLVILASGSVYLLRALASTAKAQSIARQQCEALLFSMAEMGRAEVEYRASGIPDADDGAFRTADAAFEWDLALQPDALDLQAASAVFSVRWERGGAVYEKKFQTHWRTTAAAPVEG
jgi:type II secretory pathway component PulJ